ATPGPCQGCVDICVSGLEVVGAVEVRRRLRAPAQLDERVPEVVVRVGLVGVGRARSGETADRRLQEGKRRAPLALLHEGIAAVVERVRVARDGRWGTGRRSGGR